MSGHCTLKRTVIIASRYVHTAAVYMHLGARYVVVIPGNGNGITYSRLVRI